MSRTRLVVFVVLGLVCFVQPAHALGATWESVRREAAERFGDAGAQAAAFLAEHRPERDAEIDPGLVIEHIEYALRARESFPWAGGVTDELFLNDVLPYAVLDETRGRWRPRLHELSSRIVAGATSAEEAAQALNRDLFGLTNVRYSTARRMPNQSSLETLELGLASCTGLSILLVEACRSVGIPARVAGIASWVDRNGNHTWVEIHDGERWRYTGAAEHDTGGLDRVWFTAPVSLAIEGHERHGVWASSWRTTGSSFPLAWSRNDRSVSGVDVTSRYAKPTSGDAPGVLAVRLWSSRGGTRVAAEAVLSHNGGEHRARTHADPDDVNRVAEFPAPDERPLRLRMTVDDEVRFATLNEAHSAGRIVELYWNELGLCRDAAISAADLAWNEHADRVRDQLAAALDGGVIRNNAHELRLLRRDYGEAPESGRSLWISMHGGGGTTTAVNDRQWQNQIRLYQPEEGIYIAPRAPSDTWNLWHRPEVDDLFDRLLHAAVVVWGIDPNRVYLTGYSAGGDGVYQLAPRMADRFAAAAMMAGHPNDSTPDGLRNLPFAIFMGANDGAYNRNGVAMEWGEKLAALREEDPEGYTHLVRIYPELGHWMQGRDAEGIPWMARHVRNPWPRKVVWRQGNTCHPRFYWLAVAEDEAERGRVVRAEVEGQRVALFSDDVARVELLLSDELLNLDEPITVVANDRVVFRGFVPRTEKAIARSISLRQDPAMIATASLWVTLRDDTTED